MPPTAAEKRAILAEARAKAAELLAKLEQLAEMDAEGVASDDG
jgi:vacuolar-type H+-ATPase subunit H